MYINQYGSKKKSLTEKKVLVLHFIFFFKGKCYFSLCHSPRLFFSTEQNTPLSTPPTQVKYKQKKKKKTKQKDSSGLSKNTVSVVWGTHSSRLPFPLKASQELTINTSPWTASRNRINTMNIFMNSCPFYKLSASDYWSQFV